MSRTLSLCLFAGCRPAADVPLKSSPESGSATHAEDHHHRHDHDAHDHDHHHAEGDHDHGDREELAAPNTPANESEQSAAPMKENDAQVTKKENEVNKVQIEHAKLSTAVVLGEDESLYAGIPGDGDLTVKQIRTWLEQPEVHESLEVTLPLGLSLGQQQMVGLDDSPLTRAKVELGRQLYFDTRLSSDATISCASCHDPNFGYAADTQFGVGVEGQTGNRNSPVSYNRILSGPQFWDGRAESLEEQAKGPIANPIEMGNTHEVAVATIAGMFGYQLQFETVYGKDSVNIENIVNAIAAFERAIVTGPSPYDYWAVINPFEQQFDEEELEELKEDDPELYAKYVSAKKAYEVKPMSDSALRGRELFFGEKANCTACHVGANFTDEKYHNLGVGMDAKNPDLGRFEVTGEEKDKGAFKTPTVRNVEFTAPYMHDGSQKTLEEVVEWYAKGGTPTNGCRTRSRNLT